MIGAERERLRQAGGVDPSAQAFPRPGPRSAFQPFQSFQSFAALVPRPVPRPSAAEPRGPVSPGGAATGSPGAWGAEDEGALSREGALALTDLGRGAAPADGSGMAAEAQHFFAAVRHLDVGRRRGWLRARAFSR